MIFFKVLVKIHKDLLKCYSNLSWCPFLLLGFNGFIFFVSDICSTIGNPGAAYQCIFSFYGYVYGKRHILCKQWCFPVVDWTRCFRMPLVKITSSSKQTPDIVSTSPVPSSLEETYRFQIFAEILKGLALIFKIIHVNRLGQCSA